MTKTVTTTRQILILPERCKGCGFCIEFCSKKSLCRSKEINSKGYYVVEVKDASLCNGCNICGKICPEFAIDVFTIRKAEEAAK